MESTDNIESFGDGTHGSGLSYMHNPGRKPFQYVTLGNVIEITAAKYGHIEAIVSMHDSRRITFLELFHDADKLAAGFWRLGLVKGDRIGIWALNSIEYVTASYAAARAGLITVTLNPTYEANELKYCINKCGIKALICPDVYKTLDFYGKLCTLISELKTSSNPNRDEVPTLSTIIIISQLKLRGTHNYYDVLSMANDTDIQRIKDTQSAISPDDICNIQFSSGTTGFPKAVCLTHFKVVNNAYEIGKRLAFDINDDQHIACIQVPLFHIFGLLVCKIACFQFGITTVFPSPTYNSTANLNALEQEKCSIVFGTPTMFLDLVNLQKKLNKKICATIAGVGGALCTPNMLNSMKDILKIENVMIGYGATECGIVFLSSADDNEYQKTETVGYMTNYVEAKVVDSTGSLVPFGTPGELCIRGYSTMAGYWNDTEKTKEAYYDGNWYRTGDQFILQEDGYGRVVGRVKDMIIRGGENIFPKEIEDFLSTHPSILEAYIIGVDSERLGEEVCACVLLKQGSVLTLESLQQFCKGKMAGYKIPSYLKIVESFPKTGLGKVQKFLLKQQISDII